MISHVNRRISASPSEGTKSVAQYSSFKPPRQSLGGFAYAKIFVMNKKDFSLWHTKKTFVHNEKQRPFYTEREVWFCTMGENIGYEQDGRGENFLRPILILKKFNNEVLWAIPLTTNKKTGKYYYNFNLKGKETSTAILSQIRLIDGKRLQYKMGDMKPVDFEEIKIKIKQLLA